MPDIDRSYQQLIVTNFGLSPSGYAGSRGDIGYTGSTGTGYTGSIGSAGPNGYTGSQGAGYTGSAGAGGVQVYEEDLLLGTYTALNFVGASVTAATQVSGTASITVTATSGGATAARAAGYSLIFGG
jgi:hypothetical protein